MSLNTEDNYWPMTMLRWSSAWVEEYLFRVQILRTRYLDQGFSTPVPGDLWLDAEGNAEQLTEAGSTFTNAGRDIAAIVALGVNAAIAPLEPELVYESIPGLTE